MSILHNLARLRNKKTCILEGIGPNKKTGPLLDPTSNFDYLLIKKGINSIEVKHPIVLSLRVLKISYIYKAIKVQS